MDVSVTGSSSSSPSPVSVSYTHLDVYKRQEYICSDFIVDLLGLESNRISFTEFHQRIREDHRLRLKNEYMALSYLETYEQMFPIRAKDGEIWVYSKINFQKPDKEGYRNMTPVNHKLQPSVTLQGFCLHPCLVLLHHR